MQAEPQQQPQPHAGQHPQQPQPGLHPQQGQPQATRPVQQAAPAAQQDAGASRNDLKQQLSSIYEPTNAFEIPSDLYEIAPNLRIFDKLLQCEKNIDKLLAKKRIDIQEQLAKPLCRTKRILRIHVFNNHANQGNPMHPETGPYWILRIQAKLLNHSQVALPRKFSYFIQKLQVVFDKADYPGQEDAVWRRNQAQSTELDGFEIKRYGSKETTLKIVMNMFNYPAKFKLEQRLADILGINNCPRVQVFTAVWEYIKLNRLQDKENKNIINNDIYFKEIFGCEKMSMDQISLKLKDLLFPMDPIVIYHRIKLAGDCKNNETIHDIEVDLDFLSVTYDVMPFFAQKITTDDKNPNVKQDQNLLILNQKLKKLEKKCVEYIEKLKRHKAKKDTYEAYQKDPTSFIDNLIQQQNNYLQIMHDDELDQAEEPRKLAYLLENEDLVEREIRNYLKERDDMMQ